MKSALERLGGIEALRYYPPAPFMKFARPVLLIAIFLTAFGVYVHQGVLDGGLSAPPEPGDGHDYDALAFNLWRHHRFGFDWNDAEWRQPYLGNTLYMPLLSRRGSYYPTTYRQPGAPLVMALVYGATNRSFAAWRIVSCALMAGSVTAAAAGAVLLSGLPAAVFTAALALALPLPTMFSYLFMSESLAAFLAALLAWRWILNERTGWTPANAAASGVILGALVCTRSIFVLFMPLAYAVPGRNRRSDTRRVWSERTICFAVALLVAAPWWVRNIVVLRAFMPLGTQGALNIPAGFGPRALELDGVWSPIPGDDARGDETRQLDPVSAEVRLARLRSRATYSWARDHPLSSLRLAGLHVWEEIKPRSLPTPVGAWLFPAAVIAAFILRRRPAASVIGWMAAANVVGIAATWSVAGRFMIPVQPILAALVGAAAAEAMRGLDALE